MEIVTHYAIPFEEIRAQRWMDAEDYLNCPPKLCGNGSFHASWSDDWKKVNCNRCLSLKKEDPDVHIHS